ncbi:MAG: hypothetical protein ACTSPA_05650 [Promethearchaeota archaeon]
MVDGILSLILFGIELILLIIICAKNRDHPQFWIIFTIMLLLQTYQLIEFLLCIGVAQNIVVRLAISIITYLPPTGYLLTIRVMQCKRKFVQIIYYLSLLFAVILSFYYLFVDTTIVLQDCNPLYAVYQIGFSLLYGVYYYLVLFISLLVIFYQIIFKGVLKHKIKGLLVLIGYISFLLPMAITLIVDPLLIPAISSIMCKYAILLAIMLLIFSFYRENEK